MKILVFSLGPVFPVHVHGGSQKVLRDLCLGLAERGHQITILCTKRPDNFQPFELNENILVEPILPLKKVFPSPYHTSPFNISTTIQLIQERLLFHDLFYLHDGGLNIEFLKNQIPTVISLRDFCYPETLIGAINTAESDIIVNSDYTYGCLLDSFVLVRPEIRDRVSLIYNGYDPYAFTYKKPSTLLSTHLGVKEDYQKKLFIGFPHRAELSKGLFEALHILEYLIQDFPEATLLVTEYLDKNLSAANQSNHRLIQELIDSKNLSNNVHFHPWVPHYLMPEYYSMCKVVLCIGDFVESFSNVAIESLLCGTPVVTTNTATYRSMPIQPFVSTCDVGNPEQVCNAVKNILKAGRTDTVAAREFIVQNFAMSSFLDKYENIFTSATIKPPLRIIGCLTEEIDHDATLKLTSWCHVVNGQIFNDYERVAYDDLFCMEHFKEHRKTFAVSELMECGISLDAIKKAVTDGVFRKII